MGKLRLSRVIIWEDDNLYRVIVDASLKDLDFPHEEVEVIASVEIEFVMPMDTKDLGEIEKRAITKAEKLLRLLIGKD